MPHPTFDLAVGHLNLFLDGLSTFPYSLILRIYLAPVGLFMSFTQVSAMVGNTKCCHCLSYSLITLRKLSRSYQQTQGSIYPRGIKSISACFFGIPAYTEEQLSHPALGTEEQLDSWTFHW